MPICLASLPILPGSAAGAAALKYIYKLYIYIYTLWLFNIATENGPFIEGLPIKNGDFPWLCLKNQRDQPGYSYLGPGPGFCRP